MGERELKIVDLDSHVGPGLKKSYKVKRPGKEGGPYNSNHNSQRVPISLYKYGC